MIKVSVEVRNSTASFRVGVQAQSISRSLSVVGTRFPTSEVRVEFPIDPDGFVVHGSSLTEMVEPEHPQQMAA